MKVKVYRPSGTTTYALIYFLLMGVQENLFVLFSLLIVGFLVVDLGYFNRQAHIVTAKSALMQSLFWISLALGFAFLIFIFLGHSLATDFISAYVTEKMLSVDNLFVIMLIFSFFKIEEKFHHKVLFWGIMGAIVFRAFFIFFGALVVANFHWVLYIFGALLVFTGIKLFSDKKEEHVDFNKSKVVLLARRFLPISADYHNGKFFTRSNGRLLLTDLVLIIILIEATDIIFAIDSIPAAFAITQNSFIVFTSNIFAIMGLRALFFLLESIIHKFHYLQKGLSFVLIFIGVKMLLDIFGITLSSFLSFRIIIGVFGISLILSVLFPKKI